MRRGETGTTPTGSLTPKTTTEAATMWAASTTMRVPSSPSSGPTNTPVATRTTSVTRSCSTCAMIGWGMEQRQSECIIQYSRKFSRVKILWILLVREQPRNFSPTKFQVHNRCKVWMEARPWKFYPQNLVEFSNIYPSKILGYTVNNGCSFCVHMCIIMISIFVNSKDLLVKQCCRFCANWVKKIFNGKVIWWFSYCL